ncbi:MAG: PAS domain S-box protein [Melioribacteraceae bacterium]|nr:MAG: PAS domain S-box protein [Melioribacteraceae bacterium]
MNEKINILFIVESAEIKKNILDLIDESKFSVLFKDRVSDAKLIPSNEEIDLIILEVRNKEVNSVEVSRANIAELINKQKSLILVSTNTFTEEHKNNYKEFDVIDYLSLPIDVEKFSSHLKIIYNCTKQLKEKNLEFAKLHKQLKQAEERFNNLLQNIPNGFISVYDRKYRFFFVDGNELPKLNLEKEKMIGKTISDVFPATVANKLMSFYEGVWRGNKVEFEFEYRDEFYLSAAAPIMDLTNTVTQIIVITQNITESKKNELSLRRSEEKFSSFMNHIPAGIFIKDFDGRYRFINRFNEETFGMHDWDGKKSEEFFGDSVISTFDYEQKRVIEEGKYISSTRVFDNEGNERIFNTQLFLIENEKGEKLIGGVSLDETEYHHAMARLEESEEKYRSIFENSVLGIFRTTSDGRIIEINDSLAKIYGYNSSTEMLQEVKNVLQMYANTEDRSELASQLSKNGYIHNYELLANHKDNYQKWVSINATAQLGPDGEVYFDGTIEDITDKKNYLATLKQKEQEFREIFNSSVDALFIQDISTGLIMDCNDRTVEMYGYSSKEEIIARTVANLSANVSPYDEIAAQNYINMARETGSCNFEWLAKKKTDENFWVEVNLKKTEIGGKDRILAIVRDINERKAAAKRLEESELKYRNLFENQLESFAYHEILLENDVPIDYRFIDVNNKFIEQTGLKSKNDIIGKRVLELWPRTEKYWIETYGEIALTGVPKVFEHFSSVHNRYYLVNAYSPQKGFFATSFLDITEKKKTELALRSSEEKLRAFFESDVVGTVSADIYGGIHNTNKKYLEIIGYSEEEVRSGKVRWNKITPEEFSELETAKIMEAKKHGSCKPYEKQYIRKDGTRIWVIIGFVLIGSAEEELIAFILDIQKMKENQLELERRNKFIQTVMDNLPIGVALNKIKEGSAFYENQKFNEIYGWPSDDIRNVEKFFELVYPDPKYRKEIMDRVISDMQSGDPQRMKWDNCIVTHKDGSKHIINAQNIPLPEQNIMVSTVIDVTAEKQIENLLKESEERYRVLVENAPDAIAIHTDGKIVFANPASKELLEADSQDEIIGLDLSKIIYHEDAADVKKRVEDLLKNDKPMYFIEERYVTLKGNIINAEVTAVPIIFNNKKSIQVIVRDISERKRAEIALKESEEKYRLLVNNQTDLVVKVNANGEFEFTSKSYCELFGKTEEELIGKQFIPLVHEDDVEHTLNEMKKLYEPPHRCYIEQRAKTTIGWRWLGWSDKAIVNDNGEVESIIGVGRDITERKEMEQQILAERNLAEMYLETAAVMMIALNNKGEVTMINREGSELLGYSKKYIIGKNWVENFVPQTNRERVSDILLKALAGELTLNEYVVNEVLCRHKKIKTIGWHNNILRNEDGNIIGVLSSGEDITESIRLQQNLESTNKELSELTKHIQDLRESERSKLAREIHDDLGQALTAIKLDLSLVKNYNDNLDAEIRKRVESAIMLVNHSIKTVQQITSELRPGLIDDLGLLPTIEWYANEFSDRSKIETNLTIQITEESIKEEQKITIYRILQESLTNVIRHAEAKKVNITLKKVDNNLVLAIADNGKGIPESEKKSMKSFGLIGMRERASSINAELEIESKLNKGTTVTLTVPL